MPALQPLYNSSLLPCKNMEWGTVWIFLYVEAMLLTSLLLFCRFRNTAIVVAMKTLSLYISADKLLKYKNQLTGNWVFRNTYIG